MKVGTYMLTSVTTYMAYVYIHRESKKGCHPNHG